MRIGRRRARVDAMAATKGMKVLLVPASRVSAILGRKRKSVKRTKKRVSRKCAKTLRYSKAQRKCIATSSWKKAHKRYKTGPKKGQFKPSSR